MTARRATTENASMANLNESKVAEQNEAAHQHALQAMQQQWLGAMNNLMIATTTAAVNTVLGGPGTRAQAFHKAMEADVPHEQQRAKGAAATPRETGKED